LTPGGDAFVGAQCFASEGFELLEAGEFVKIAEAEAHEEFFGGFIKIGRPMTLRPAVVMSFLSRRVEMTPEVLTPRISEISGAVTGCL
jgi:hypothetical protein